MLLRVGVRFAYDGLHGYQNLVLIFTTGLKLILWLNTDANSPNPTLTGYTSFPGTHLG